MAGQEMSMVPSSDRLTGKPERTLDTIAAEIRVFTAGMLNNVIEIGRRMIEAKELVPYGQFGAWIKENTGYSVSTANNFMNLYMEYGSMQGSLFGAEAESQTFGKLSYSKALALLSVPAEEREAFAKEVDAEHTSVRELKRLIEEREAERDAARRELDTAKEEIAAAEKRREDAVAEVREAAEKEAEGLRYELDISRSAGRDLEAEAKSLREEMAMMKDTMVSVVEPDNLVIAEATANARAEVTAEMQGQIDAAKEEARKHEEEAAALREQLEELKQQEPDESAIEEAVRKARAEAVAELQAKLDKANAAKKKADEKRKAAEEQAKAAKEQMEAAQAEAKQAAIENNRDLAAFSAYFDQAKVIADRMRRVLLKIRETDAETAGKLGNALDTLGNLIKEAAK